LFNQIYSKRPFFNGLLSGLAATYTGSAHSATVTTSPTGLATTTTYNGNSTAPTNAGSYTVVGTVNNSNYVGDATNTLVIAKAAGKVKLSDLSQKETGSGIAVTSSTVPAGMAVTITYDGSAYYGVCRTPILIPVGQRSNVCRTGV